MDSLRVVLILEVDDHVKVIVGVFKLDEVQDFLQVRVGDKAALLAEDVENSV
jgi:hypothetical protein